MAPGANTCPDYVFYDARIILVIDHPTREATLVGASVDPTDLEGRLSALAAAIDAVDETTLADEHEQRTTSQTTVSPVVHAVPTQSDADFAAGVETMKEAIAAGDVYQVVPSRGFTMPCPDALAAYHELRGTNPSPYMFYLGTPDFELFGASPSPRCSTRPRPVRSPSAPSPAPAHAGSPPTAASTTSATPAWSWSCARTPRRSPSTSCSWTWLATTSPG